MSMSEEEKQAEQAIHKKFAVNLYNFVWQLLEKSERSLEEDDTMLHAAHASRYHWGEIGEAVNFARGEWQISRVYSVLNRPEPAHYHAQRCLTICQQNNIADFDLAYAYEALARAAAVAQNTADTQKYLELAHAAGENIAEADDKALLVSDLETIAISINPADTRA